MNRPILFRGKALHEVLDGKWFTGWYSPPCEFENEYNSDKLIKADALIAYIDDDKHCQYVEVDDATVGQYTGLTDKNGVKIFEGDIVEAVLPETKTRRGFTWPPKKVVFQVGEFRLVDEKERSFAALGRLAPAVTIEVKGNIHDNPELMEGGATDGV